MMLYPQSATKIQRISIVQQYAGCPFGLLADPKPTNHRIVAICTILVFAPHKEN